ncbi:MAG: metallophosphoesterase, partial [Chloroflexi bacterium]|nr:metallophosphoesterase [Chloroflexota bacterium]
MRCKPLLLALLAAFLILAGGALPAEQPFHLVIMGSTDLHGHIYPTSYLAAKDDEPVGFARVATLVQRLRGQFPHTLLVDSGDILQGTALDYYFGRVAPDKPNPLIAVMNAMGYDAAAIGNHDYDYGLDALAKDIREAHFPFLSANTFKAGTDQPYWTPYAIQEHWGIKIGFVGFTTPGVAAWSRNMVQGKLDFRDIVSTGRQVVAAMKRQGADLVVVLAHSGL